MSVPLSVKRSRAFVLPSGILTAFIRPLVTTFFVDLPLREEPLTVDFHQFVFVVSEPIEDSSAFRIIVGIVNQYERPAALSPSTLMTMFEMLCRAAAGRSP